MLRTFAAVLLLTLLAIVLTLPGTALAGPAEGVFDKVGAGLDRCRKEKDPSKRLGLLEWLAPSRDPRVGVALGEYLSDFDIARDNRASAAYLALQYFVPAAEQMDYAHGFDSGYWWRVNRDDLCRRAKQLPK